MKKSIIIALAFLALNLNAQTNVSTYNIEVIGKEFPIKFYNEKNDKYSIYIEGHSFDNLSTKGGFVFNNKEHDNFILSLNEAKQKYIEWVDVAKKNNVQELNKIMDIKCKPALAYFYYGDELYIDMTVSITFKFSIINSQGVPTPILILSSNELVSTKNEFIKSKGLAMIFSNVNEIDTFLNTISKDKINAFMSETPKSDLFK